MTSIGVPPSLAKGARTILGRPLTEQEAGSFLKYMNLLVKWNKTHRLVGSADPEWIIERLLLDSLLFLRILPAGVRWVLDFGTGAGVPGIPIKIVWPEIDMALLESKRRRVSFLLTTVRELGLTRTRVLGVRAEDLVAQSGGTFDAVVMRCAGNPDRVLPLAAGFVREGGIVVAAGPPKPVALTLGRWVQVPGVREKTTRRFAVLVKAGE